MQGGGNKIKHHHTFHHIPQYLYCDNMLGGLLVLSQNIKTMSYLINNPWSGCDHLDNNIMISKIQDYKQPHITGNVILLLQNPTLAQYMKHYMRRDLHIYFVYLHDYINCIFLLTLLEYFFFYFLYCGFKRAVFKFNFIETDADLKAHTCVVCSFQGLYLMLPNI